MIANAATSAVTALFWDIAEYLLHCCCFAYNRMKDYSFFNLILYVILFSLFYLSICDESPKAVSDQLKNARLTSSTSSQLKHLLSSSLSSSGHHQDPLEAALLAAARSQHGAGIPGKCITWTSILW